MKNLVLIASVVSFCFLVSCNSKSSGMSDKAKKNLESANAIAKMFETGDFSKLGDYVAADGVDHAGMNGDIKGVDSMKASYGQMLTMMSDMKNESVKEIADDDYTFQWMKESMTPKQDMMGVKAGTRKTINAIEVSKFNADGKATEHWTFIGWNDMMQMMPQQPPMDTTKMKMEKPK